MVRVKVPVGSGLDTKDDLHIRKGHTERGNLSVGPIDDACDEMISLHLPRHYSRVRQERKRKNATWTLTCDMAGSLIHMNVVLQEIIMLENHGIAGPEEPWKLLANIV